MSSVAASTTSEVTTIDKSTTTTRMPDGSQRLTITTQITKSDGSVTQNVVTRTLLPTSSSRASLGGGGSVAGTIATEIDDLLGNDIELAAHRTSMKNGEDRALAEENSVFAVPLGIETQQSQNQASSSPVPEKVINDDEDPDSDSTVDGSETKQSLFKSRKCQAAIMISIVLIIAVTFLGVTLGIDWFGLNNDDDLCTLCGDGLDFTYNKKNYTPWPTRQPSSTTSSSMTSIANDKPIKPPPENLAKICAPSIYLDHGPSYKGPSAEDLIATCTTVCLPGE